MAFELGVAVLMAFELGVAVLMAFELGVAVLMAFELGVAVLMAFELGVAVLMAFEGRFPCVFVSLAASWIAFDRSFPAPSAVPLRSPYR
jgi:hypothetical protein